jgi:hypothetical protein
VKGKEILKAQVWRAPLCYRGAEDGNRVMRLESLDRIRVLHGSGKCMESAWKGAANAVRTRRIDPIASFCDLLSSASNSGSGR